MSSTAAQRMRALRQRRKAEGCKTAKLWLLPEVQAQIERLRRPGESLDDLFARGLEAIAESAPLHGKITLLQTEYIAPLREEVAKLKKRLGNAPPAPAAKPASQAEVARALAQLQAKHRQLEQTLRQLEQDLAQLRAQHTPKRAPPPA